MHRVWRSLIVGVALLVLPWRAFAAETGRDWFGNLPVNQWQEVDEKMSGNRLGAQVVWLAEERKLIVAGGLARASERESRKPERMIFDPATGRWSEYRGEPKLPTETPKLTIVDAAKRLRVTVDLPVNRADLAGSRVGKNSPLAGESRAYVLNNECSALIGSVSFFDPVNEEVHLIGGSTPGLAAGAAGNWIFSLKSNSWRSADSVRQFDENVIETLTKVETAERDAVAAARNSFYSTSPDEREKARGHIGSLQDVVRSLLVTVDARLAQIAQASPGDSERIRAASELLAEARRREEVAHKAPWTGLPTAAEIAAAEDTASRVNEAIAALASSPPARRFAGGVFDPKHQMFYLFGGDHGDYTLNDLWVYRCAERQWRQLWAPNGPEPRFAAQLFLLPQDGKLVVFGGRTHLSKMQYQRFDESRPPDVWLFDPAELRWQMAVDPGPETKKLSRDNLPVFLVNNPAVLTADRVLICPAVGGNDYDEFMISSTWMARLDPSRPAAKAGGALRSATNTRMYRSQRAAVYDPQWYDAAPPGDAAAIDQLLKAMPTNEWVELPTSPRPCPERSWGTSIYDPLHDQLFVWSGGHCADPADIVHHFHPGLNRWSIGYVAGGGVLGNQLTSRPDCNNHTYHNFAWDPVSGKMIVAQRAGTHVYDPERREWTGYCAEQPFVYDLYGSKVVGTRHGVVVWAGGNGNSELGPFFGVFDAAANRWRKLPLTSGKVPPDANGDEGGITWDSRRDLLYLNVGKSYEQPDGHVHQYDFASGKMTVVDPQQRDKIGDKFFQYRETVYLPEADLVLFGMKFINDREVAYDPAHRRWLLSSIPRESRRAEYAEAKGQWTLAPPKLNDAVGSISFSPVLDTRRHALWAPSDYKAMFVLKLDEAKLAAGDRSP